MDGQAWNIGPKGQTKDPRDGERACECKMLPRNKPVEVNKEGMDKPSTKIAHNYSHYHPQLYCSHSGQIFKGFTSAGKKRSGGVVVCCPCCCGRRCWHGRLAVDPCLDACTCPGSPWRNRHKSLSQPEMAVIIWREYRR